MIIKRTQFPGILLLLCANFALLIQFFLFPTKSLFFYPLIPYNNYVPNTIVLILIILTLCILYLYNRNHFFTGNKTAIFLTAWMFIFCAFFIINQKYENPAVPLFGLDFRYLLPAFPPFIILSSYGITKLMTSNYSGIEKTVISWFIAAIVIINILLSCNLFFYFHDSATAHMDGFEYVKNGNFSPVYTHWPFVYASGTVDIGKYSWKSSNLLYKKIQNYSMKQATNKTALLFSNKFYKPDSYISKNAVIKKFSSQRVYINPVLPKIEKKLNTVVYVITYPQ